MKSYTISKTRYRSLILTCELQSSCTQRSRLSEGGYSTDAWQHHLQSRSPRWLPSQAWLRRAGCSKPEVQCEKNPQTPLDKPRSFPFDAYPAAHTYSKPDGKVQHKARTSWQKTPHRSIKRGHFPEKLKRFPHFPDS